MHALAVATSLREVWSQLTAGLLPILSAYRARLADLDVAVKADDTLLSEADIAVQERIVALVSECVQTVNRARRGSALDRRRSKSVRRRGVET
jgi:3'-phosphoadenosine 5'-phosphosulfate (PAPS) 3'-phosphatase